MNQFILILAFVSTLGFSAPKATFRDSYLRYVSTHDVIRLFQQKFPITYATSGQVTDCFSLTDRNRMLLGSANPATGELAYAGPSPAYIKHFGLCLIKLIDLELKGSPDYKRFIGPAALKALEGSPQAAIVTGPLSIQWKDIPLQIQSLIAKNLVDQMIGPGILKDEASYVQKLITSSEKELADKNTLDAFAKLLFYIGTQDEFLSY